MIIRFYGARGSTPVSGKEYVKYGGDTTCVEIRTRNDEIIIVDAGTGIRRLGDRLLEEGRYEYNMIFTHSHLDHIVGFPFFGPLFQGGARILLQGCPTAQGDIEKLLSKAMSPPLFPVPLRRVKAEVRYTPEQYEKARTWGHSTYIDALNLAMEARVKHFGLFHHNRNRDDAAEDAMVDRCHEILAEKGYAMDCFAVDQYTELTLTRDDRRKSIDDRRKMKDELAFIICHLSLSIYHWSSVTGHLTYHPTSCPHSTRNPQGFF